MAVGPHKVDQSNYSLRLKELFNKQIRLQIRETNISKISSKFHDNLLTAMEKADWQQREHERIERLLVLNRQELDKRVQLEKELTRELEATKQQEATVREHNNELMECIHALKRATGTSINHDALPARVKGVTVLRNPDGDQWVPFDLAETDAEGLNSLCQRLQKNNIDVNKWRQLVSLSKKMSMKWNYSTPPRRDNDKVDIIEIDLTSPTNHI
ncbi:kinetochore protein Spc25 [Drosophila bipectinata]|uniref:kinetochore protein Spc25 n=1 Tax=Drosophila bipectinata TaxID=42026 RepID=UPI001C8AB7D3|nr:kinetochore protein Spc25 [Drosophila bipectinata]